MPTDADRDAAICKLSETLRTVLSLTMVNGPMANAECCRRLVELDAIARQFQPEEDAK